MITVASDSSVYADVSYGGGITRFTKDGQLIDYLNFVNRVEGFAIDASGNLYICGRRVYGPDPLNPFIEGPSVWKFNPQQELIKKWGYPGPADTTGWHGGPMIWNPEGHLVMMGEIDSSTAVFEFTPDGNLISSWRIPSVEFQSSDIACDTNGRILISSPYNDRVYIFDSHGKPLVSFVDVSKNEEPLNMPAGITVDTSGFIYVVDYSRYRIVKYRQAP